VNAGPIALPNTKRTRRFAVAVGVFAIAVGVITYVGMMRWQSGELPPYGVSVTDGGTHLRVVPSAKRDARFEVVLRPPSPPAEKLVAYAFAMGEGAEPTPLEARVDISPEGVIRIAGAARALEGARELRVVVGAPVAIGGFTDAVSRAESGRDDALVRVVRVPIEAD
jgi:hypothetical protein